jgi:DNA-binding MarR family transcriptional regulator
VGDYPMNETFFSLKRAHLARLRLTRRSLARMGLTAARFDLLYVVLREGKMALQRNVRTALGVSAATVSRMLGSLEDRGLLRREPLEEDLRHRCIELTREGRRCIRKALRHFVHSGYAQLAVDSALCPDRGFDEDACSLARGHFCTYLLWLRLAFGDVSNLDDPWGCEDCED